MKFADKIPLGYNQTSAPAALAQLGVPVVCVPRRRPAAFGFYAPAWTAQLLGDPSKLTRSQQPPLQWKLRLIERASRLVSPADCDFVEEALCIRALTGDEGLLAWLDEKT